MLLECQECREWTKAEIQIQFRNFCSKIFFCKANLQKMFGKTILQNIFGETILQKIFVETILHIGRPSNIHPPVVQLPLLLLIIEGCHPWLIPGTA